MILESSIIVKNNSKIPRSYLNMFNLYFLVGIGKGYYYE